MSEKKSVEIHCPACHEDTLLLRAPQYDGFTKIEDQLSCSSCGHVFDDETEISYKDAEKVSVFTEADRSRDPDVFTEEESGKLCRYCANYVINPFTQWCSTHKKEVEATDTCDRFEPRKEEEEEAPPPI